MQIELQEEAQTESQEEVQTEPWGLESQSKVAELMPAELEQKNPETEVEEDDNATRSKGKEAILA